MSKKAEKKVEDLGYEEALADLDRILEELEGEETDLDSLAARVARASELVRHCKARIQATELEVEKVLEEMPAEDEG